MGGIAAGAMGLGIVISLKDQASRGIENLKTRIQGLKTSSEEMTKAFTAGAVQLLKGVGIMASGAILLSKMFGGPIRAAVQFESVMADVNKVANFTTSQYKEMSAGLVDMSKNIPVAVEGLGNIMAAAAQAGIAKNELLDFTRDAAYMGVAFDIAAMEAGDAMAGLRSILGITQEQVILLGDSINHLSNNMNARAPDLLNFTNRAGGIGRMAGMTGQQISAFGAAFLDLKTPPEVAARAFSSFIMKLTTATSATKDAQGAFTKLGTTGEAIERAFKKDATSAMFEFLKAVKSSSDPIGILRSIVGEGFADDLAKLAGGSDKLAQALGLVGTEAGYAGSMLEEYEARANTTENAHALLANRMKAISLRFGQTIAKPYRLIVNGISSVVNAIAGLPEPVYMAISLLASITGSALVLGGGLMAIGGILKMWPLIWRYGAQMALMAITTVQNGARALAATMRTALLPMLKWAAVAGVIYLAWKNNFGGIKDAVRAISEGFKMAMRANADGIVEMDEALVNSLKKAGIWEFTVLIAKVFWRMRQMWQGFKEGFADSVAGIKQMWAGITAVFRPLFEAGRFTLRLFGLMDAAGKSNIDIWRSWGYAIGVITPILMITLTAIKAFGIAVTIFNGVKTAILAAKAAVIAMNVAMLANPAGVMIAGFALVVAMITTVIYKWDEIKATMAALWGWVQSTFPGFAGIIDTFILAPIRGLIGILDTVWGIMKKIFGARGDIEATASSAASIKTTAVTPEITPVPVGKGNIAPAERSAPAAKEKITAEAKMTPTPIATQAPAERSAPAAKERPKGRGQATAALAGNKNSATIVAAENSKAAGSQQAEIKNNVDVNVHPQEINVYIDKNKVGKAVADYNAKEDKRKGRTR